MSKTASAFAVAAALILQAPLVVAQATPPEMSVRDDRVRTGSNIRRSLAWSTSIPLNRTYSELSDKEKQELRDAYEAMPAGDEPPFPEKGLKPIVEVLVKIQHKLLVTGELKLLVTVNAQGDATEVAAYGSPSPEMTKLAASLLMVTKYKPAVCGGQKCVMQYPFYLAFSVR